MNLHKLILVNNDCYKAGKTITPKGIMVHSTGANNPSLKRYVGPNDGLLGDNKYGNHWNNPKPDKQQKCVHGFIGKIADGSIASYQTLPWDMRGWHCGKGKNGSGNDTHIGIEICEDGLADAVYFNKVYTEAVELFAYLCKQFNLDPTKDGVIICHSEGAKRGIASNHGDVMHWFPKHGKSMDTFRADVAKQLAASKPQNPPVQSLPQPTGTLYRVQCGAFSIRGNADALAARLKAAGYKTYIVKVGNLYKVQVGAFSSRPNAVQYENGLKAKGFSAFITTEAGTPV